MVGRLRVLDEMELVLARGSVGLALEADAVRANHLVGLEKKWVIPPDGDADRVKVGKEGEGLITGGPAFWGETARLLDVFDC